jgi:hypothetical protein
MEGISRGKTTVARRRWVRERMGSVAGLRET